MNTQESQNNIKIGTVPQINGTTTFINNYNYTKNPILNKNPKKQTANFLYHGNELSLNNISQCINYNKKISLAALKIPYHDKISIDTCPAIINTLNSNSQVNTHNKNNKIIKSLKNENKNMFWDMQNFKDMNKTKNNSEKNLSIYELDYDIYEQNLKYYQLQFFNYYNVNTSPKQLNMNPLLSNKKQYSMRKGMEGSFNDYFNLISLSPKKQDKIELNYQDSTHNKIEMTDSYKHVEFNNSNISLNRSAFHEKEIQNKFSYPSNEDNLLKISRMVFKDSLQRVNYMKLNLATLIIKDITRSYKNNYIYDKIYDKKLSNNFKIVENNESLFSFPYQNDNSYPNKYLKSSLKIYNNISPFNIKNKYKSNDNISHHRPSSAFKTKHHKYDEKFYSQGKEGLKFKYPEKNIVCNNKLLQKMKFCGKEKQCNNSLFDCYNNSSVKIDDIDYNSPILIVKIQVGENETKELAVWRDDDIHKLVGNFCSKNYIPDKFIFPIICSIEKSQLLLHQLFQCKIDTKEMENIKKIYQIHKPFIIEEKVSKICYNVNNRSYFAIQEEIEKDDIDLNNTI